MKPEIWDFLTVVYLAVFHIYIFNMLFIETACYVVILYFILVLKTPNFNFPRAPSVMQNKQQK